MKQNFFSNNIASNVWLQKLTAHSVVIQQRASLLLCVLLLVLSAWMLGKVFWLVQSPVDSVTPWVAQPISKQNKAQSTIDTSSLTGSHLFGEYKQESKPIEKPVVQDAPKTRLNLTLVGVVASSDNGKSLAVIANRGRQATYGLNEQIEGTRVQLKAVFNDRVIIDNSGRDETLMLAGIDYSKLSQNTAQNTAAVRPSVNRQGNNPVKSDNESNLETVRAQISEDPQKIFQYVRMSQVKRDGNVIGYRVTPGKEPELFRSVGLESGDIATQLNGHDLTDPVSMSKVFSAISELSELNLTVERDGQTHDINIEF
ncbi:type II secretion system protein GspC [Vibrio genomosp. F10]|uniref:Type II secretion system protein GspC n=1 Tax=Vibrio genomosp. F10 str. ZF-129 TaxID=1187848 RepID=A0A1E5BD47_9VIBR|nr:type II secretion system protein GspC [Vibrio genomosp. F10 str. ZF-129]OEE98188.1 type II secretion system protein GspC [Vibrio genomosp. F10 str. 9ZC157]OEF04510.1 type II secretion system protein GspC [Vibrio genomosp. F10 str. 9ZB36]OEF04616.1 type II secretion system protein GspC [Vibrio genomosp. F10 str. 9ZD137]